MDLPTARTDADCQQEEESRWRTERYAVMA